MIFTILQIQGKKVEIFAALNDYHRAIEKAIEMTQRVYIGQKWTDFILKPQKCYVIRIGEITQIPENPFIGSVQFYPKWPKTWEICQTPRSAKSQKNGTIYPEKSILIPLPIKFP